MYSFFKRLADIIIAMLALIILSPLFFICIIILSVTGEGEIFFFQERVGYQNKIFTIWKFATMLKNSVNIGTGVITLRNDPRVTPFGKFLRKTKINELPQIVNVLLGDMSIVGPRPLMKVSFDLYSPEVKESIYNSRPGITGIGSLIFRDEEKIVSSVSDARYMYSYIYSYKGELELWYNNRSSFSVDSAIIFCTALSIVFPSQNFTPRFFTNLPSNPLNNLLLPNYQSGN